MKSGPVPIYTIVRPVESWNPLRVDPDESFSYIDLGSVDQERKVITQAKQTRCGDAPSRVRQLVKAGDILVSTVRPNLNGVAQVPHDLDGATASTGFCVLRPDPTKADPRYLMQWVGRHALVNNVAMADLRQLRLVSPSLEFQHQFGDRVRALKVIEKSSIQSESLIDNLFASLQDRAFRGAL